MSITPGYTGHNSNTFIGAPPTGGPPTHSVFIPTGAANGLERPADAPDGDYNSARLVWSISFWIKWADASITLNNMPVSSQHPSISDGRDGFRLRPDQGSWVTWQWRQSDTDQAEYRWFTALPSPNNDWHHYLFTRDTNRASANSRMRLFVDGVNFSDADASIGLNQDQGHTGLHWAPTAYPLQVGTNDVFTQDRAFYLYDLHSVDAREAAVTEFGFDDNGTWKAIEYTGNHGPSGYNLDFENAGDLGADVGAATNAGVSQPHNTIGTGVIQSTDTPPRYVP